jgi:hypothetical protein
MIAFMLRWFIGNPGANAGVNKRQGIEEVNRICE